MKPTATRTHRRPAANGAGPGARARHPAGTPAARRHRVRVAGILLVWILATGAHWDIAQFFAWGRMFSSHAGSMTLVQAATQTFGGETCNLCKAVSRARQQENQAPLPPDPFKGKLVLACPAAPRFLFSEPARPRWLPRPRPALLIERAAPPSPPPRDRDLIS